MNSGKNTCNNRNVKHALMKRRQVPVLQAILILKVVPALNATNESLFSVFCLCNPSILLQNITYLKHTHGKENLFKFHHKNNPSFLHWRGRTCCMKYRESYWYETFWSAEKKFYINAVNLMNTVKRGSLCALMNRCLSSSAWTCDYMFEWTLN